jgi:hypothetical protein
MSTVTAFLLSHLIDLLEKEFIALEPKLQDILASEVDKLVSIITAWLDSKKK